MMFGCRSEAESGVFLRVTERARTGTIAPVGRGKSVGDAMAHRLSKHFTGRTRELVQLERALERAEQSPQLATVLGPAGVGKSTLARRFLDDVRSAGGGGYWIGGDDTPPNAYDIQQSLAAQGAASFADLGRAKRPDVLVLDAFERFAPLARWFFEAQLPHAGLDLLILLTTREKLEARLRMNVAIQLESSEISLENFSAAEAVTTLARARVPAALHSRICALSQGHPLLLSLFAERYGDSDADSIDPTHTSNALGTLVRELLREAPTPLHRDALYALSLGSVLDADLLRAITTDADADGTFAWLSERSFVSVAPGGIAPHPLVREALFTELTAAHPVRHATLTDRMLDELERRLPTVPLEHKLQMVLEMIHVRRDHAMVRDALGLETMTRCHLRRGTDADAAIVERWIAAFEGDLSAELFRHWYGHQPRGFHVLGDEQEEPAGVYFMIHIGETTAAQRACDPIAQDAWRELQTRRAQSGTNDEMGCGRWFFARGTHQAFGVPNFTAVMFSGPLIVAAHPRYHRWVSFYVPTDDRWLAMGASFGLVRLDRTVEIDGRLRAVDVRELNDVVGASPSVRERAFVRDLLERMGVRLSSQTLRDRAPATLRRHTMLDDAAFQKAVRSALPILHQRHALRESPLVESAMVSAMKPLDRAAAADQLVALIVDTCSALGRRPATAGASRILMTTFTEPAVKQQAVAAALKLPYGTYRYQLRAAIDLLARELWELERTARERPAKSPSFDID